MPNAKKTIMLKRNLMLLTLTTWATIVTGQNLVPNYSFESYNTCPDPFIGQSIEFSNSWFNPSYFATTSSMATPDYYNTCSSTIIYSIPFASWGFQNSLTGNAYAGMFTFQNGFEAREYLQAQLTDTLESNKCYLVTFYASLHNLSIYATNNLAANFLDTAFAQPDYFPVNLQPHVYKFGNPFLTDTLNWIKIQGVYTALGNERYITIGNFKNDFDTDTLNVNPYPSGTQNGSYYLIENVSVIPLDSIVDGMPAFGGRDTTITSGDSIFIGQEITNLACNWYIGNTLIADSVSGLYVNPTTTTTYTVEQNLCGTITYDTVTVFVSSVGITENQSTSKTHLFPNPFKNSSTLKFDNVKGENYTLTVFDGQGKLVRTITNIATDKIIIERRNLLAGLYCFQLRTDRQIIATGKLIIEQ